jgi:tetratricopeptide (TPR) repeat protein
MPARVNGIGTTYLGKKDVQVQQGVCESCRRPGPLSNYETRLWFSVFYIPLIPLAKKQIINYCSRCTRHRSMDLDQWRDVQADAIGSAIADVDANPDSPDHAVQCHATMAACGKREEAAKYADAMLSRFGNSAEVLMYLGAWFERIGQSGQADKCFDRALAADPKHPGALRAVAVGLAQQNLPREAEAKLATLQPPSEHYDPALFFAVAQAYQNTGDHAAAARLFKVVADTTPSAAKEKKFRQAVQLSEAALGRPLLRRASRAVRRQWLSATTQGPTRRRRRGSGSTSRAFETARGRGAPQDFSDRTS